jgi:heat shock protein 1/8
MTSNQQQLAETYKEAGNTLMKNNDERGAIQQYTKAIDLDPNNHILYSNRSAALIKVGDIQDALIDAEKCVEIKSDWAKGYSRLGQALLMLNRHPEAVAAFAKGLTIEPGNKALQEGMNEALQPPAKQQQDQNHSEQQQQQSIFKSYTGNNSNPNSSNSTTTNTTTFTEDTQSVIGIDLGTTFSCVGVWEGEKGGVTIIPDSEGRNTTPSVVSFQKLSNGTFERRVGHDAKRLLSSNPKGTIYDSKRIIGQRFKDEQVQRDVGKFPFQVRGNEQTGKPEIVIPENGPVLTPEEVGAIVLSEMKKIAEQYLKKRVTKAVITVPAYFSDAQRQATKDAGRIAGLDVLRVVNEPTAAALAYGLDAKLINQSDTDGGGSGGGDVISSRKVLVFDLGGGTFDVSILSIEGGVFEVIATGGDTHLGGEDFDNNLVEHMIREIKKMNNDANVETKKNKLKILAEQAKITLSSAKSTKIALDSVGLEGLSLEITRAQFEKINSEPFKRCMTTVKNVLRDAKLETKHVEEIVLVGGSTRIPSIREQLRELFNGKQLCQSINPDEAVAYGAAVQGAIMSTEKAKATQDLILVDVTPLSLGIECTGKVFSVVIPRNTTLPTERTKKYSTEEDNQTAIDVRIFEGERPNTDYNNLLGEFTITGIERAKRGVPEIEVTFAVSVDGMLRVSAKDVKTGATNNIVIAKNSGRLSESDISKMLAEAEKYRQLDQQRVERIEVLNEFEHLLQEIQEQSQSFNSKQKKAVEAGKEWLDGVDRDTILASQVRARIEQLLKDGGWKMG